MSIDKYITNTHETINEFDPTIRSQVAEGEMYRKNVKVAAVQAAERTPVETILADGTKETSNFAEEGDYIVANPDGEVYVIRRDNFDGLYEATDKPGIFQARGVVKAIENPTSKWVQIEKSWGIQEGAPDCMLVVTCDPQNSDELIGPIRIVGRQEFGNTYVRMNQEDVE